MKRLFSSFLLGLAALSATADETTILLGPKTIGRGWKDNIVLEPRHFANANVGDIITVYIDNAKGYAQGAFQNPTDWQGIAPEYAYFKVNGPFRMTITDATLPLLRQHGVAIGGHDFRILRATLTPAADWQETVVWKGPAVQMKDDWSASAQLTGKTLAQLQAGDGLRLHISKAKAGAAAKLMDMTWHPLEAAVDGVSVGGEAFTYYVNDEAALMKIQLAGPTDNIAMRIGGHGFRLDQVGIVKMTGQRNEDLTNAQRAPREYELEPGEVFHGEKPFPNDWSGNLRITAAPFQDCTENSVVIIQYDLLTGAEKSAVSFRENHGKWKDLSGNDEPQWQTLDGVDYVLTFDAASLDRVKTYGMVVTGVGFVLKRIEVVNVE